MLEFRATPLAEPRQRIGRANGARMADERAHLTGAPTRNELLAVR